MVDSFDGSPGSTEFERDAEPLRRYQADWGSLDVSDAMSARRSGLTRYRLEIFPPGTSHEERARLLRFRQFRFWGAFAGLSGILLVGGVWPGWPLPLLISATWVVGLAVGLHRTRRLRGAIHSLNVAVVLAGGASYIEGDAVLLETCATELERLDRMRSGGDLDPLRYELEWSRVYAELESSAAQSSQ